MQKKRICRHCKLKVYVTPSKFPGCCSDECYQKRKEVRKQLRSYRKRKSDPRMSQRWFALRYKVLAKYRKCCLCGSQERLQVDHIKPYSKYPHLVFQENNLQVLCRECNQGKSNKYEHDFRDNQRPHVDIDRIVDIFL